MMGKECACEVDEIYGGFYITYCPRHAAADAMYEALEFIDDIPFRHYPACDHFITSGCDCGVVAMKEKACAAIAIADGD